MKKKIFTSAILVLCICNSLSAQNPFESLGVKNIKVLTFSNGKFNEFFDNDTIEQIGSILFNTVTNEIVAFVERDTTYSEATLKPEITSRWLSPEPLAAKYPYLSPYVFVKNNPILNIDPDGRDVIVLNAPNNVGGLGHASVLIGNDKTGWRLYSKNGTEPFRSSGPANKNRESGIPFGSFQEFHDKYLNSDKNYSKEAGGAEYSRGFRITTSEEVDAKMAGAAKTQTESWYDVTGTTGGSCINVCEDALRAGGLDPGTDNSKTGASRALLISKMVKSTVPNEVYENITKNNAGVDISKQLVPSKETKDRFQQKAEQDKKDDK